ncbi:hypothetical protein LSCM1_01857 [Leishmania martiniquensis]|uniref:Cytidyltransferase-like domain-containing protein n=1 Tax=Leishmania martiniquensis TaxID=1580590 RepID=A0A836G9E0_9TRYP|nr:hypothetical protein LSCM1_01857 [Leishmania martiniquensis]
MAPSVLLSTAHGKEVNAKSLVSYLIRSALAPVASHGATAPSSVSAAPEPVSYRCSRTELQCGNGGGVDVYLAIHNQHRSTFLEHSVYLYSAALEVCPQLSISIIPVIGTMKEPAHKTAIEEVIHVSEASSSSALPKRHQQVIENQWSRCDGLDMYEDVATLLRHQRLVDKSFMRDAEGFQPTYKYVAVGGTFDHFHSGHKVLLSTAALHAMDKLRVGVTDASLLARKKFAESLQSMEERMENVTRFLRKMRPDLELDLASISEVSGGTKSIPEVEALVVSPETRNSLGVINEMRAANGGLAPMAGIFIPEVRSPSGKVICSTALRGFQAQED